MDTKFCVAQSMIANGNYWQHQNLKTIPTSVRVSRRLRRAWGRRIAYLLDLERQYHTSDDVSEARWRCIHAYKSCAFV